jgi:hypothetical protein
MEYSILILAGLLTLSACSTTKTSTMSSRPATNYTAVSRDGSSYDLAVIIEETTESRGVSAEYQWLALHYPGYSMNMQSIQDYKKKPYDIISITTADGKKLDVYFDISKFYGKF